MPRAHGRGLAVATLAILLGCAGAASAQPSDCCAEHPTPGCDTSACQTLVCQDLPHCCNDAWDLLCATHAQTVCGALCAGGSTNDCCQASPTGAPGCNDPDCQAAVCAVNPNCCTGPWDPVCANIAANECAPCAVPGPEHTKKITFPTNHAINFTWPDHVKGGTFPDHVTNVTFPTEHEKGVTFPEHFPNVTWPPDHKVEVTWPLAHEPGVTFPKHVNQGTFPPVHHADVTFPPKHGKGGTFPTHTANITFPPDHAKDVTFPNHVTSVTFPKHQKKVSFP